MILLLVQTMGDLVDATCDSIVGTSPMGAVQPVPPNPPGARQISGPMSGDYIVGLTLLGQNNRKEYYF